MKSWPTADVVNLLRIQHERQRKEYFPGLGEYIRLFGLTKERAKRLKPDCLIMHPGPINRGVEIDSELADGAQSVILDQVTNGLAVRMAVLYLCGGICSAMNTVIRNGRIIDPANKRDEVGDLVIVDGRIADLSEIANLDNLEIDEIDASNLDRRSRPDRSPRASARAGIRLEGDNRNGRARGGGGRIHHASSACRTRRRSPTARARSPGSKIARRKSPA